MELVLQIGILIEHGTILQAPVPKYDILDYELSHWRNR